MFVEHNVYDMGISMLQMLGENLQHTSKKLQIFRLFNYTVFTITLFFITLNFSRIGSEMYSKTAESVLIVLHLLVKYTLIIRHKPDFHALINVELKQFWEYEYFHPDVMSVNKNLYRFAKFAQLMTVVLAYLAIYAWFLGPYLSGDTVYPMETWIPNNSLVVNSLLLVFEFYLSYFTVPTVYGYDIFYLSLCVDVIIRVRLLKSKLLYLSMISPEKRLDEIKNCARCHQLLLRIFKRMKHIFSVMLLFHYFVTIILSCVELYEFVLRRSNAAQAMEKLFNVFVIIAEFAFYTFPAEALAFEFTDISTKIYMSNWYDNTLATQKELLLMMVQCQRTDYFTGGGIIQIHVETFVSVTRKAVSFCAVLRNLLRA